jgi:hypothetical protein
MTIALVATLLMGLEACNQGGFTISLYRQVATDFSHFRESDRAAAATMFANVLDQYDHVRSSLFPLAIAMALLGITLAAMAGAALLLRVGNRALLTQVAAVHACVYIAFFALAFKPHLAAGNLEALRRLGEAETDGQRQAMERELDTTKRIAPKFAWGYALLHTLGSGAILFALTRKRADEAFVVPAADA